MNYAHNLTYAHDTPETPIYKGLKAREVSR
jgi:hypothetical protein